MTTAIESNAIQGNEPVALLIAINDYRAYDSSGKSDLRASWNDLIAYWKVCRRLGYQPQNIYVLTSPKLSPSWIYEAELDMLNDFNRPLEQFDKLAADWCNENGVNLEEATRENIESRAMSLWAGIMEYRDKDGELALAGSRGFLAYSGHGMRVGEELALCPSDIKKDGMNAIKLSELKSWILGDDPRDGKEMGRNLTVVLDCCFAAARGDKSNEYQRVTSLGEVGQKNGVGKKKTIDLGNRIFCAAGPDESAYQAMLGGYWYSAFTWAFTVALEQWQIHEAGDMKEATISHSELLFRTRMLLKALSFRQHPILMGKFGLSNDPVFVHYDKRSQRETSVSPNAQRDKVQLRPDYKYTITGFLFDNTKINVAVIYVPYGDTKEYWHLNSGCVEKLKTMTKISVGTEKGCKANTENLSGFDMTKTASTLTDKDWQNASKSTDTVSGGTDIYFGKLDAQSPDFCLRFNVDLTNKTFNGAVWYAKAQQSELIALGENGTIQDWKQMDGKLVASYYRLRSF